MDLHIIPYHQNDHRTLKTTSDSVKYKQCMRNHAASMGVHASDGCGEFIPLSDSLTCAACGCHRNFHKKESPFDSSARSPLFLRSQPPPHPSLLLYNEDRRSETPERGEMQVGRKRFRTKFTAEQKERMLEFAERIGWRIQKNDNLALNQFCCEIGVKRNVLKVWMHNNKNVYRRRDDGSHDFPPPPPQAPLQPAGV